MTSGSGPSRRLALQECCVGSGALRSSRVWRPGGENRHEQEESQEAQ